MTYPHEQYAKLLYSRLVNDQQLYELGVEFTPCNCDIEPPPNYVMINTVISFHLNKINHRTGKIDIFNDDIWSSFPFSATECPQIHVISAKINEHINQIKNYMKL